MMAKGARDGVGDSLMKRWMPVLAAGLLAVFSQATAAAPALVVGDNHMRVGPGIGYPIILTVVDGSTVNTRRCRGLWCEVRIHGRRGFVNIRRLDFAAYAPPREVTRGDHRRSANRKSFRSERTSSVSRGARELPPRHDATQVQPRAKRMPAAQMPRGPLPPPPVIEAPPTVPAKPTPSLPSQAPEKPQFKPPEGAPEISL